MVMGLRGFPGVQGGVETHAQNLYPELVKLGSTVTVIVRSPYQEYEGDQWEGVRFKNIWAPRISSLEAIVHSLLAVVFAGFARPDVLHIHAIGPAIVTPIARLFGLRVVVTHHGPDYDREKWGRLARLILRLGERFGMTMANERIVISPVIEELVKSKYGLESTVIPNGVRLPEILETTTTLAKFGLREKKYVLLVSRLVPEKRHFDLLEAFEQAGLEGWKLVFVGNADHKSDYQTRLLEAVEKNDDVVFTGFLSGNDLGEIYSHAGLFVLPSSHEGLPIALLEALSYGLPCLASDIPANLVVELGSHRYFSVGDIEDFTSKLKTLVLNAPKDGEMHNIRAQVSQCYNWHTIAGSTFNVFSMQCPAPN
jgi:glycosyltransferase involved in cell wall biosynthesis